MSPATIVAAFDERRLSLVRAAYEIIAAQGFEQLRTREVANRVGVNIATLHYYFATKQALVEAVALYLAAQFETVRSPGSALAAAGALRRLRQEFTDARFYLSRRPEMIEVMRELNSRAGRDRAIARIVKPLKQYWRASIAEIIAAGVAEGVFHPGCSPSAAAGVITAMLWGAATFPLDSAEREFVYGAIERWLRAPTNNKGAKP